MIPCPGWIRHSRLLADLLPPCLPPFPAFPAILTQGRIHALRRSARPVRKFRGRCAGGAGAGGCGDAGTFSLIALFKRLLERVTTLVKAAGQAAMSASHPVVIASDQTPVAIKTNMAVVSQEITRPSDTTAYAFNDVVGPTGGAAVGNLADIFRENGANGGSGYITKVELLTDQIANVASYRIYFFNAAPTAIADNVTFELIYADAAKLVGYVDIVNMSLEGSSSTAAGGLWTGQLAAVAAAADYDLFYVIVTKTAFTPASDQKYTLKVTMDQNA